MKMRLRDLRFLFLDCQTTGMRPPAAQLLEFAWGYATASDESLKIESHLLKLSGEEKIPPRVSEITGIHNEDLANARLPEEVLRDFRASWSNEPALIHYAQFEKPFLTHLYAPTVLPLTIFCTHQLCKRVFPNLPSQNIRGAAGFFGLAPGALKRAGQHVQATHQIWRGLIAELEKCAVDDLTALQEYLRQSPRGKSTRYEYRLDRVKRLELPDTPGIYRMLSKAGDILYVGKATSLKDRVNSYFRGYKGRDRRKLEMLAQVWDLKVTPCATPLEAALLETDEIKRHNPPYNVVLKRGRRHLLFYNHDFSSSALAQSQEFPHGPFRQSNWIEHLRLLYQSLNQEVFEQIFFNPIDPGILRQGWEIFRQTFQLEDIHSVRTLLARGMWILKNYTEPDEELEAEEDLQQPQEQEEEEEEEEEEREPTPEEIAGKFERLLRRSAAELRRARQLSHLLNARVTFHTAKGERRQLQFRGGRIRINGETFADTQESRPTPWSGLDIEDFDRMSILLSELAKYEHRIELIPAGKNSPSPD